MRMCTSYGSRFIESRGQSVFMFFFAPLCFSHTVVAISPGASVVVALSFAIAVFAFRVVVPTLDAAGRLHLMPWVSAWQAISVAVFLLVIAAGLLGPNARSEHRSLAVWVIGWAGLSLVCSPIGDVWVILSPAAVRTWTERLARSIRLPLSLNLPLPTWVGSWPALGLFFGFAWCELLWDGSGHPHDIADLLIRYSALTWIGMVLFGRTVWLRTGEALSVAFGLFGCFAPVSLRCVDGGRIGIGLRPFGIGHCATYPARSRTAFLILMLATVTFDGLGETPVGSLLRLFSRLGDAITIATAGSSAASIFWVSSRDCLVLGGWRGPTTTHHAGAPSRLLCSRSHRPPTGATSRSCSWVCVYGAAAIHPFGLGWDLAGADFIWSTRLVGKLPMDGGVIAIVSAMPLCSYRVVALRVFTSRASHSNQVPMLALMVTYTMTSLWILAQPITNARAGG